MAILIVPRDHLTGHPVSAAAYEALAGRKAAARGRALVEDARPLEAYVSHGAWVADCPHCGSGIAIHPEWSFAACLGVGCHRVFRAVTVPDAWRDIESVLAVRPMRHQNWLASSARTRLSGGSIVLPDEPLDALIAENLERGLVSGLE